MIKFIRLLAVLPGIIVSLLGVSQSATILGTVMDEEGKRMQGVSVVILGRQSGTATSDSGTFSIQVKANKAVALVFTAVGFQQAQKNFYLSPGETEHLTIVLTKGNNTLQNVTVTSRRERQEAGLVKVNPKMAIENPAPIGGIENMLKVFVNSRSELSSQYEVRGGNYDENLVYVNDFEVFRPYLVRSGQQEGLSFINPELAKNVNFYNGGFQVKYGDKMSSVLDVEYKKPTAFHGSAYIGLLEQGFHVEGASAKKSITWLLGVRNRSLGGLLGSQEVKGNYIQHSADLQALVTWQLSPKWLMELMSNVSSSKFSLVPEESSQTTSVFTPMYSTNLGLDIQFDGQEKDEYKTRMLGLSATRTIHKNFRLKGMLGYFNNRENESINIAGKYLFGERDFDKNSADFGLITNPLGAGIFLNYARNELDIKVLTATLKGTLEKRNNYIQFGSSLERNSITDKLNEFDYQDSAGYSLPYQPGPLNVYRSVKANSELEVTRMAGFIQDNVLFDKLPGFTLQAGLRYNYNDLNKEFLLSPRAGISFTPKKWKQDVIFRIGTGLYHQPPFYREMRRYDGTVNTAEKAQRSFQVSGGGDYAFKGFNRPMRVSMEAWYKNMWNVVPYDIDNVRVRYYGENMAKAYAYGIEGRLFGELVKDAESWLSIGFMKTMENLDNDYYQNYYNKDGELITGSTPDQEPADSVRVDVGWLRRPTDRRINFGMYFSDYLTTNKSFKVYLQTLFGTNLPYNIPGSVRYRNALEIPSYFRVDMGFSYQLLKADKSQRRSHDPFRNLENMWLSFEVFNLLDKENTISYTLIKDFGNNTFAVPNRLTPRLVNIKLVTRW